MEKRILRVLQLRRVAATTGGCFCCSNDGRLGKERYLCVFPAQRKRVRLLKVRSSSLARGWEGELKMMKLKRASKLKELKVIFLA
jgi:hypothetical protein